MHYVGIDPGNHGAVAILSKKDLAYHKMPKIDEQVFDLFVSLSSNKIAHVILEHAQAMPKNGSVGMFNYGNRFGFMRGILIALKLPHSLVRPKLWQKTMFVGTPTKAKPKSRALAVAKRLFPKETFTPERCRTIHDGVVDATLMAEYGRRMIR